jgi:hypothetical protein
VNALTLPARQVSSRGPGNHTPDPAGGRLLRLTWGGTRRFIGRLLTGSEGIATLQERAPNRALDLAPMIRTGRDG